MKNKITVFQKPTCNTCRIVLRNLKENGIKFDSVNYYEKPFTKTGLKSLLKAMKASPRDILRFKEPIYKKLGLGTTNLSNDQLIELMIKYPDLIQRPIIVQGNKVFLARPIEKINSLLKN